MLRLRGEVPLFDIVPFERERHQADAEHTGRTLTAELATSRKSIDLATDAIHKSPLFAGVIEPTERRLFTDL